MGNVMRVVAAVVCLLATATVGASAAPAVSGRCTLHPTDGLTAHATTVDGVRRTYELYVPAAVVDGPVSLVLAFHGLGGSGANHVDNAGWVHFAEQRGFVLIAPDGLARSWQFDADSPDLALVRQLLADSVASGCIDTRRVHAVGHSMGGHFSHRVACSLADVVASVAVYAGGPPDGALIGGPCEPARPISVAMWHGDADSVRNIDAGRRARDGWVERNDCVGPGATVEANDGLSILWACAAGTAVFWREYRGQPHAWPEAGSDRATQMGNEMLDFLERHLLPISPGEGRGPAAPNEMQLVRSYHSSFQGLDVPTGPRSGTAGGAAVHEWFGSHLSRLGLDVHHQAFGFNRYIVRRASLEVRAASFAPDVFPLYYRGATSPAGVTGPIVDVGSGTPADYAGKDVAGKIAVAHSSLALHARPATLEPAFNNAVANGAAALVVAIDGPGNHLFTPNSPVQAELGPLPVLFVGQHDGERLRSLDGATATFVLDAFIAPPASRLVRPSQRQPEGGIAYNTFAVVPGTGDGIVVVGTPLNGWFEVAAERASGVAVLLEVSRRVIADGAPPSHTLVFVGLGGHEVEAGGLHNFLACFDTDRIVAYVHMGATVAGRAFEEVGDQIVALDAQEPGRTLHLSENPVLHTQAHAAFGPHLGVQVLKPGPGGAANPGEQADAYAYGVPIVAISGANLFFHTAGDVPDTLSQSLLAPMSDSYTALMTALLGTTLSDMRAANSAAATIAGENDAGACPAAV